MKRLLIDLKSVIADAKPVVIAVLTTRAFAIVLASLLVVDALLLSLHVANVLLRNAGSHDLLARPFFNLGQDRGLGELFGYAKQFACALLLTSIWRVTRARVFVAFALLYLYGLVDDSMSIHEQIGHALKRRGYMKELGEAPALIAPSLFVIAMFAWEFRSTCREHRILGFAYFGLFAALAFFAVLLDALHVPVIIEDGGELITLSLHAAFTVSLYLRFRIRREAPRQPVPLSQAIRPPRPKAKRLGRRAGSERGERT